MMSHGTMPVAYEEVVEAVDTIRETGKAIEQITAREIRTAVGDRGSYKTLLKHRDRYKEELKEPEPEQYVTDDDIARVRTIVNEVAARHIATDREKAEIKVGKARAQIKALEAKITDLEDVAAETEQRLEEALDQEASTREQLVELQGRLTGTEAALKEARWANETLMQVLSEKAAEPAAQSAGGGNSRDVLAAEHKAAVDVPAVNVQSDDTGNDQYDDHDIFPLHSAEFTFADDE